MHSVVLMLWFGAEIHVNEGEDLKSVLQNAQAGDEIIVPDPYFVIYPSLGEIVGRPPTNNGWTRPGPHGQRILAPHRGIAIQQVAIAKHIIEIDAQRGGIVDFALKLQRAIAPGHKIMVFGERQWIGVVRGGLSLRFRERNLRGQASQSSG